MLPPEYMHLIVEERQRELRRLGRPFVLAAAVHTLRVRLAESLVRLGIALIIPDPAMTARPRATAELPPQ
jgi:hypothetical protein